MSIHSDFTALVVTALERKRRLDAERDPYNTAGSYNRWLVDAVELLLQIELERRGNPK